MADTLNYMIAGYVVIFFFLLLYSYRLYRLGRKLAERKKELAEQLKNQHD